MLFARKITARKITLLPARDDGIVVVRGRRKAMSTWRDESVAAAMTACADRFERRLVETSSALRLEMAGLRQEMRDGFSALRHEMDGRFGTVGQEMAALRHEIATRHADQLKWSFLFWVGQVAVVAGLFGVLLRALR